MIWFSIRKQQLNLFYDIDSDGSRSALTFSNPKLNIV